MTNVPCANPAHGVKTHIAGSEAAAQCASIGSAATGRTVSSIIPSSARQPIPDAIDSTFWIAPSTPTVSTVNQDGNLMIMTMQSILHEEGVSSDNTVHLESFLQGICRSRAVENQGAQYVIDNAITEMKASPDRLANIPDAEWGDASPESKERVITDFTAMVDERLVRLEEQRSTLDRATDGGKHPAAPNLTPITPDDIAARLEGKNFGQFNTSQVQDLLTRADQEFDVEERDGWHKVWVYECPDPDGNESDFELEFDEEGNLTAAPSHRYWHHAISIWATRATPPKTPEVQEIPKTPNYAPEAYQPKGKK